MNPDSPTKTEVRAAQRTRWLILLAVGVVVLLIGLILAKQVANQRRDKAAVQQALDRIRAAGQPVRGRELMALRPNPPPERDWRTIIEPLLLANPLQTAAWGLLRSNAPLDLALPALRSDLASNAPVLAVVLQTDLSALDSRVDWPVEPDQVWSCRTAEIFKNINLTRALGEQAVYAAATGHPDLATAALVKSFQVAQVGAELFLIEFVCQQACEGISLQALEMAVNRSAFADADLQRLERALPRRATNSLHAAVIAGRVGAIWLCELARDHPDQFSGQINGSVRGFSPVPTLATLAQTRNPIRWLWGWGQARIALLRQPLYRPGDFLALLDRQALREQATRLPLRERLSSFERADKEKLALDTNRASHAVCWSEPKYLAAAKQDAVNQVRLALAHTALAVERWRLAHEGRLPENLAELVPAYLPAVPADPFDDQPIRFKHLPQGFVVYSVGLDGTDNGGKEDPAYATGYATDDNGYDVTFTIKRRTGRITSRARRGPPRR